MIKKLTTKEIFQKNQKRTPPDQLANAMIWLHDIRSMHNVGSAFRTADAFGLNGIILTGYTPAPPRPEISKTALGAEQFVSWTYNEHFKAKADELKDNNYKLIAVEQTSNSTSLTNFTPAKDSHTCYIFGNEVTGIDQELLSLCDEIVEIPQFGKKHSFNVSVSIGIVLYDSLIKSY